MTPGVIFELCTMDEKGARARGGFRKFQSLGDPLYRGATFL